MAKQPKTLPSILSALTLGLALGFLTGCDGPPTPNRAYHNCVGRTIQRLGGSNASELSNFSKDLHRRIAEQECAQVIETCKDAEGTRACQRMLKKYQKPPKKQSVRRE
jgi:hypothetical protein